MSEEVEVCVRLPRGLVDFLKAIGTDVEEYLTNVALNSLKADIEDLSRNPLISLEKFPCLRKFLEASK